MRTDLRPSPLLTLAELADVADPVEPIHGRRGCRLAVAAAALIVCMVGVVSVSRVDGDQDARVQAGPPVPGAPIVAVLGVTETAPAVPTPVATTVPAVSTTLATPAAASPAATPTTAAAVPAPTAACRNSSDPVCGPFRFDPQPGPDTPMTVQVVAEPASPRVGQPVVFRVTLLDPDGVSHGSSLFDFGDSGIGEMSPLGRCQKYGSWDLPARDPADATEIQESRHTYMQAGTYTATFAFEAGPYECVDSVSGRGDRPYASSGSGTATVVVRP